MKKTNDYLILLLIVAFMAGITMLAIGQSDRQTGPQHQKSMNYDDLGETVKGSFGSK